jgi:hypothetical protein
MVGPREVIESYIASQWTRSPASFLHSSCSLLRSTLQNGSRGN